MSEAESEMHEAKDSASSELESLGTQLWLLKRDVQRLCKMSLAYAAHATPSV